MSENEEITMFEDPNRIELDITTISNTNIVMEDYDLMDGIYNEMSEEYYSKININILRLFAEYYGLSKKGKKQDLIQNIIIYESDPMNKVIVDGCKKMWLSFNELKNNKVFAKYILSI